MTDSVSPNSWQNFMIAIISVLSDDDMSNVFDVINCTTDILFITASNSQIRPKLQMKSPKQHKTLKQSFSTCDRKLEKK